MYEYLIPIPVSLYVWTRKVFLSYPSPVYLTLRRWLVVASTSCPTVTPERGFELQHAAMSPFEEAAEAPPALRRAVAAALRPSHAHDQEAQALHLLQGERTTDHHAQPSN